MEDEHVMETLGKSRVVIRKGIVVSVSEPRLGYCPLFHKYRGVECITKDVVRENIEERIREFGLFTENRDLDQTVFVGFGTSEIFMTALDNNKLDAVVCVCEGAGTVITANPALVQGIGARLSGLVSTTPIPKIISGIEERSGVVLDPGHATIDQFMGLIKARGLGYRRVGVTLIDPIEAKRCKEFAGSDAVTFLVHTTGIRMTPDIAQYCDLVTSCASRGLREGLGKDIKVQAGSSIPIFAMSEVGKELLLDRARDIEGQLYISTKRLPHLDGEQPKEMF